MGGVGGRDEVVAVGDKGEERLHFFSSPRVEVAAKAVSSGKCNGCITALTDALLMQT